MRFSLRRSHELADVTAALRAIESDIHYPLDDDRFTIVHGHDYGAFMDTLGASYFLLPFDGEELLGVFAASLRDIPRPGRPPLRALYIADLKLQQTARGGRVSRRLFAHGLRLLFTHPDARGLRLVFGAGMIGSRGDVRQSFRKRHVGRLGSPFGELVLFFATADQLVISGDAPPVPAGGIDLSGDSGLLIRRNTGLKDFRLESTGEAWRLAHLPRPPSERLGQELRSVADQLEPGELATFAVDSRLTDTLDWLDSQGLRPAARCNLLGLLHPLAWGELRAPWLHLSTAEI